MKKEVFKFRIQSLSFGWCRILMQINDKEISFNVSYIGPNPLASLVETCLDIVIDAEENYYDTHHITWETEPGLLKMQLQLDKTNKLHIDLNITDDRELHETIHFNDFVTSVVSEGFRVLNAFGLYGYRCSWSDQTDFPLSSLLRLTGKTKGKQFGDSYNSNFTEEIESLQDYIAKLGITEEKRMDECTIYYESWQLQCCGDAFAVGDNVEWTCIMPENYKNAHGIIIDLEEEHHGFATHSITGKVVKIIAERSEFPVGTREVWYHRAQVIQTEIQKADGWESDIKDDETTDRTFWGYIVELTDATIKPLEK